MPFLKRIVNSDNRIVKHLHASIVEQLCAMVTDKSGLSRCNMVLGDVGGGLSEQKPDNVCGDPIIGWCLISEIINVFRGTIRSDTIKGERGMFNPAFIFIYSCVISPSRVLSQNLQYHPTLDHAAHKWSLLLGVAPASRGAISHMGWPTLMLW